MRENMFYGAGPLIFKKAEELRKNMTSAEKIIWQHIHINEWKLKFRRQHPVSNFIVDFYCHAIKLVIEIDGDIHEKEDVKKNDILREKTLTNLGLKVLRFNNEEIYKRSKDVFKKIDETITMLRNSPLGDGGKETLYVIKIGGNIIDDETKLSSFLKEFAAIEYKKILVHGGGNLATKLAEQLGIEQQLLDGRRITDAQTLKIVTMVYAGYINKNIVAKLQGFNCNAVGLCGTDGDVILAHKRKHPVLDYGFVGDVDAINAGLINSLLEKNMALVFAPITHDGQGQLLNTNADTIAQELAKGLSKYYKVTLIYSFEKAGVLMNANDDSSVINKINPDSYKELKQKQVIFAGMIPKLDNAFTALNNGVSKVIIGKAENLQQLIEETSGTTIVND
jgi:acetylglutamate kinase